MKSMNKRIIPAIILLLIASSVAVSAQDVILDTLGYDKAVAKSPAQLIQGRVSGVQVSNIDGNINGAINTNIRGLNSLHGDSQPLWVVNGVVLTNGLSQNLNAFWQKGGYTTKGDPLPDYSELSYSSALNGMTFLDAYDIDRIEVLKDVSATAIYGSQGANGVILVTTKLPKDREFGFQWNSNVSVDFSSRTGEAFRTGILNNHYFGVGGSNNGTSYNISANLRNTNGTVARASDLFGGLNVGFETKANQYVWFGFNSTVSAGAQHNAAGTAYLGKPSTMILSRYPNRFTGDSIEGWIKDYDDDVEDYRAVSSVYFQVNIIPGLNVKASVAEDFQSNTRRIWYGEMTSFGAANNGAAAVMSSTLFNYNAKLEINFQRYFAKTHHISAQLAADVIGSKNKFGVMNGTNFELPYLRARGLSSMGSRAVPYKFTRDYNIVGTYLDVQYDWDRKVGVNAMIRSDFSTKYTGSQPILYPSADAWIDIHKIAFPQGKTVSDLTIKGGYGSAGREEYVPYEMLGNYLRTYPSVKSGTEVYYDGLNRIKSNEWTVGFEIGFVNRVKLGFKYYDKQTQDMFQIWNFGKISGSYYTWAPSGTVEYSTVGKLGNAGFELDLNADIIRNSDVHWSLNLNGAFNINRVNEINSSDALGRNIGKNIYVNIHPLGGSASSLYGYIDSPDGGLLDLNGDGDITDADRKVLGNTVPKFIGAFGTTLWIGGGFSIDLLMDGAAGFEVANLNKLIAEGRTKLSSRYVEKGDFLRLSRLTFGYEIPVKSKTIKGFRITATGTNLFTLTNYSGWNPDTNCFGNSALSYGVDYGSYPIVRSVLLGISMTL